MAIGLSLAKEEEEELVVVAVEGGRGGERGSGEGESSLFLMLVLFGARSRMSLSLSEEGELLDSSWSSYPGKEPAAPAARLAPAKERAGGWMGGWVGLFVKKLCTLGLYMSTMLMITFLTVVSMHLDLHLPLDLVHPGKESQSSRVRA